MEKVTVFESIAKIFKMIASTPLLIGVLVVSIILLVVTSIFHLKNKKSGNIVVLCIFVVSIVLLVAFNISFFVNWLDKIVENFVKNLYFPSWYMYMVAIIYTDFLLFKKLKNSFTEDAKKTDILDYVYFYIFHLLFFMIIQIVTKDKVDIFSTTDLYNNSKLLSLIQISSYIFWIRVIIQFLSFIINKLAAKPTDELAMKAKEQKSIFNKKIKEEKENEFSKDNSKDVLEDASFNSFDDSYFYKEPDYAGKLKEIDSQKESPVTNLQSSVFSNDFSDNNKTYDIFNSPKIIKETKNNQNDGFNRISDNNSNNSIFNSNNNNNNTNSINNTNSNNNNNSYKEYDYDDSNYFDDFFE